MRWLIHRDTTTVPLAGVGLDTRVADKLQNHKVRLKSKSNDVVGMKRILHRIHVLASSARPTAAQDTNAVGKTKKWNYMVDIKSIHIYENETNNCICTIAIRSEPHQL